MSRLVFAAAGLLTTIASPDARADGTCTTAGAPSTCGATNEAAEPGRDESPAFRARNLLTRARWLDETAAADERSAADIAARLPTLRHSAKLARERADHAAGGDREMLASRAEDLEADVSISEAEVTAKRRSAADNRRVAHELRARAVHLVRVAPLEPSTRMKCDPPYRFSLDGRKIYRLECLE